MTPLGYARAMSDQTPFVTLRLCTKDPIALDDFVGAFTALGNEYERFIKSEYPDLVPTASVYVRQVEKGSILAELVGWAMAATTIAISSMDQMLIIEQFVRRYGERLGPYLSGARLPDATKGELSDFMSQVRAIANDPNARAELKAVCYEDGKRKVKAAVVFDTPTARAAEAGLIEHYNDLQKTTGAEHKHVLLQYVRPSIESGSGVRRGERGKIESIYQKSLPIIYASDLARQQMQHELEAAEGNVFRLLFEVDVNVEISADGAPRAFRIMHLHQLHDDED